MRKILLTSLLFFTLINAQELPDTRQLIVVTTKDWNADSGRLQRYEKSSGKWRKVGQAVEVRLGRNGLGWGRGLHHIPKGAKYIKKEGDGRAPAGIFELKQAFGYAPFNVTYPYVVYKETDHCVDDVHSKLYNKIVNSTKVKIDYKSKEQMKFPKDYYRYGIVVNHNHIDENGAVPGAGSCIFIHIKEVPTAGCTVMREAEIKKIICWLDPEKHPLLLQGVKGQMKTLWQQL